MATKARFVRRATREAVTGPLVAAAVGLLYFLSLCFVDQGLAAFARVCPDKAQRVDVNTPRCGPHARGVELLPGFVGLTAWQGR